MTAETETIRVEQAISQPPTAVWAALTTPELIATWWAPGDVAPVIGHEFTLEMPGWGHVPCKVIDVVDEQRFVYTFADWTLSWTLEQVDDATVLHLEHSGFDMDNPQHRFAFDNMGPGWRDQVLPRLASSLD